MLYYFSNAVLSVDLLWTLFWMLYYFLNAVFFLTRYQFYIALLKADKNDFPLALHRLSLASFFIYLID